VRLGRWCGVLAGAAAVAIVAGRSISARRHPTPIDGVNVVGYLTAPTGLGERARELAACLRAAGVPVSEWSVGGDDNEHDPAAPLVVRRVTITVVTAVQLAAVRERLEEPFERAERSIGYFFWELDDVPDEQQWGIGLVDEIWAPTEFVRRAYAAATDRPVRLAPLPISAPSVASHPDDVMDGSGRHGPFTFLVSFDHLSVMERKNPIGAVEAFQRAFAADGSSAPPVRLIIKTMNGSQRPDAVARLQAAIGDDPRIELHDEQLDIADQYELIGRVDALVSLHRSEGLGLHLAEAMWLGTPVIATGYSGNLDLMDETSAGLVRYALIPVRYGDDAYPASATWADPDLDHAAELMHRLVVDEGWRSDLITTARSKMAAQRSRAEAGASLVRMLDRAERGARRTRSR